MRHQLRVKTKHTLAHTHTHSHKNTYTYTHSLPLPLPLASPPSLCSQYRTTAQYCHQYYHILHIHTCVIALALALTHLKWRMALLERQVKEEGVAMVTTGTVYESDRIISDQIARIVTILCSVGCAVYMPFVTYEYVIVITSFCAAFSRNGHYRVQH